MRLYISLYGRRLLRKTFIFEYSVLKTQMKITGRSTLFFFHPFFLSFVVTLALIILFIPKAPKYNLKLTDQTLVPGSDLVLYDDIDKNGYSDRIIASNYLQKNGIAAVTIKFPPSLFFQEWEFPGSFAFSFNRFLKTGDYDGNGKKEIYVFTIAHDSVFLHIIKTPILKQPAFISRFICKVKLLNGSPNLGIFVNELTDMNNDGYKDLVFAVNNGVPVDPRNVFIYDIQNDSLLISPVNGYFICQLLINDINGDKYNEILINGYASQNIKDTTAYRIHDQCCWLIAFDHRLEYLFPPVKFPFLGYSALNSILVLNKERYFDIYSAYLPPLSTGKSILIYHFSKEGNIKKSISIPGIMYDNGGYIRPLSYQGIPYISVLSSKGKLATFDTNLKQTIVLKEALTGFYPYDSLDLDDDKQKEVISLDATTWELRIFRQDLSYPAAIQLPAQDCNDAFFSLKSTPGQKPVLVMFSKGKEFHYLYQRNLFYYTRWGVFLLIFLTVYLFTLLIRRIQRIQILKQQRIEKKITELQMKVVRNQMDPHFTMNAINSVIAAINENEKEQAAKHLVHFSKMYRHLLLTADKIKCPLAEELEFTTNYLTMENFRFRDKFTFDISIAPGVKLEWEVPKMVIQSPVENAVKHGLLNFPGKGHLQINALTIDHHLVLEIIDNGIGREKAAELGNSSTGTGMKAMHEFLDLFRKITGTKIDTEVIDLYDPEGNSCGTKVMISISLR